jgi:cyclomaltodextrinase
MQFTLPGVPAMFAGDEIGASYQPYSNLTPISWKDKHNLKGLYERLISLRHQIDSLTGHDVEVLETDVDGALAYVRPAVGASPPVLVILNYGGKSGITMSNSPALAAAVGSGAMRDLVSEKAVDLDVGSKGVSLKMDAESSFVLVPGGS